MTSKRDWNIKFLDAKQQPDNSWKNCDGTTRWYNDIGQTHKEDGPAIIHPSGYAGWYFNNKRCSFDEWCNEVNISDENKMILKLQYA
jgi:hypothetical protein